MNAQTQSLQNIMIKNGHRIADFCTMLGISRKEFFIYFSIKAFPESYLKTLFPNLNEVIDLVSKPNTTPPRHKERVSTYTKKWKPIIKPTFQNYHELTRKAGLTTLKSKADYFKVTQITIQELEYYLINKKELYISQENIRSIETKLLNLSILFPL